MKPPTSSFQSVESLPSVVPASLVVVTGAASAPRMPSVVLDPAAIDRLVIAFGDEGRVVVAELVDTFLAGAPARLDALRRGLTDCDGDEVRRAAHSLKAGAAILGAHRLADSCRQVEALSLAGDLGAAADVLPAVEASYEQARQALEEAVG